MFSDNVILYRLSDKDVLRQFDLLLVVTAEEGRKILRYFYEDVQ